MKDCGGQREQDEFPPGAASWNDALSRRNFLQLMSASLALAGVGLQGCSTQPPEGIAPYVAQPEEYSQSLERTYATTLTPAGLGVGVLARVHLGRPVKLEGNPQHPASLGGSNAQMQAALLDFYNPARSQTVRQADQTSTFASFLQALQQQREQWDQTRGDGAFLLTQPLTSPTLLAQIQRWLERYPKARWHAYEPVHDDNAHAGARLALGVAADLVWQFERAKVVVLLDAHPWSDLSAGPRYARDLTRFRRATSGLDRPRWFAAEPAPTPMGMAADHRLAIKRSLIPVFTQAIAEAVGVPQVAAVPRDRLPERAWDHVQAIASQLMAHRGRSAVVVGRSLPAEAHALGLAINAFLGNTQQTLRLIAPVTQPGLSCVDSMRSLVDAMASGQVRSLIMLGGNPVYDAPADLEYARRLSKVPWRVHMNVEDNETSAACHWHVPRLHELESWGDARAFDGTASLTQPVMRPLYAGRSAYELLAAMLEPGEFEALQILQRHWREKWGQAEFESRWRAALHTGVIEGTQSPMLSPGVQPARVLEVALPASAAAGSLELALMPDPALYDGRFASNAWLQELPRPVTKLTWENALLLSPASAAAQQLATGDVVEIAARAVPLRAAVWVQPGHADDSASLALGYGRSLPSSPADQRGTNAYLLRTSSQPWLLPAVRIRALGAQRTLPTTQPHFRMQGRQDELVRSMRINQASPEPALYPVADEHQTDGAGGRSVPLSLYPEYDYRQGDQWGMAIDLTACIGCGGCVVACQAENNIPVVGPAEVIRGREMHWLRIDQYITGDDDHDPGFETAPVLCMHCEKAPCEVVCPVNATTHSADGLNEMTYNRCIGTRYCSNNCPYKVRRFNFLHYQKETPAQIALMQNPTVTVRSLGVMEKCTYCVQRIRQHQIQARVQAGTQADSLLTACQQACPSRAIVFGNLGDPQSEVRRLKAHPLNYSMLGDLGTQPRTTYLPRLRLEHPQLTKAAPAHSQPTGGQP